MGHVLQGHYLARLGMGQPEGVTVAGIHHEQGDPDTFLEPEPALEEWARLNPGGAPFIGLMIDVYHAYMRRYPTPPGRVVVVETEHFGALGLRGDKWGYWAIHPDAAHWLRRPVSQHPRVGLPGVDGIPVQCHALNAPGHPEHGLPIWISRRSDADIEGPDRLVRIWDHKHQGRVDKYKIQLKYAACSGFSAFRHLGSQVYGDRFGGIRIQAIQTTVPTKVERVDLLATPARDAKFADLLFGWAHDMAQREVEDPSGLSWGAARAHTGACVQFGRPCKAFQWCHGIDIS